MSDAGRRNLPSGLQHSSGQFSCGDEVNIVSHLFAYKATEQEKLARGGCSGGEGVTVSWKWRGRWSLGWSNSWSRKSYWRVQIELALGPRVGRLARLLLLLRAGSDWTGASWLLLWLRGLDGGHPLGGASVGSG